MHLVRGVGQLTGHVGTVQRRIDDAHIAIAYARHACSNIHRRLQCARDRCVVLRRGADDIQVGANGTANSDIDDGLQLGLGVHGAVCRVLDGNLHIGQNGIVDPADAQGLEVSQRDCLRLGWAAARGSHDIGCCIGHGLDFELGVDRCAGTGAHHVIEQV